MGDVAAMTWPLSRPSGALLQHHRVGRCLFGRPDKEKLKLDIKEFMDDVEQQNKLRWNFDFQKGVPIDGRYKWEPVEDPADADKSDGSEKPPAEDVKFTKRVGQTHITDYMRKRKSSSLKDAVSRYSKACRRSST